MLFKGQNDEAPQEKLRRDDLTTELPKTAAKRRALGIQRHKYSTQTLNLTKLGFNGQN